MAASLPTTPLWRTDLEGLRGLAVLLVVCFHAGLPAWGGAFVAVDVFFVLSGFFLTSTLTRLVVADSGLDLSDVYGKRVWRLMPAMALVLLATLAMTVLLLAPIDRAAVAAAMQPVAFFTGNLAMAAEGVNYFSASANPLLHTWTLGVEYQLMLFFPALVMVLAWIGKRRATDSTTDDARRVLVMRTVVCGIALAGVLSFVVSVWMSGSAPSWAYFGPHTRLWAFAAGGVLAFVVGSGQSVFALSRSITIAQLVGLAAIIAPSLLYDRSMPYPGAIALVPVTGTVLLLAGGTRAGDTPVGRALSSTALRFIGRVSYPWYLWHWPLMVLGGVLLPTIGPWGRLAWGVLALPLAWLTQRYIEQPAHTHLLPRLRAQEPFMLAVGASLTLMLIANVAERRATRIVEQSVHRNFAAARADRMEHDCWVSSIEKDPSTPCAFGDARSNTTFVLLGDSHAEHWLGGLDRAGREHGWRIEANVMGGCPVSDFSRLTSGSTARRYRECSRYREAMLQRIIARKPNAVILSSYDNYMDRRGGASRDFRVSEDAWREGLRRTYGRLAAAGIPVVVLRGTPTVPFDVPSCLSRRAARLPFATSCTYSPDRVFMARAQRAQDDAARGLAVRFVDMNDEVCATSICASERDGIVTFTDDNHLTARFTRSVGAVLGERIDRALGEVRR